MLIFIVMQKELEEQGKLELSKEEELAWNIVMQILEDYSEEKERNSRIRKECGFYEK